MPTSWSLMVNDHANIYKAITQAMRCMMVTAVGGTLISKTKDEAYNLIEEMALNHFQWANEGGKPNRVGGKFDVDALTLLTAKMDVMTQRFDRLNMNVVNSCVPSPTYNRHGPLDHETVNYQVRNPFAASPSRMSPMQITSNLGRTITLIPILTILVGSII